MKFSVRFAAVLAAAALSLSMATVSAAADYDQGVVSESAMTVEANAPGVPAVNSDYSNSITTVDISWNRVSDADGYYLYRKGSNTTVEIRVANIESGSATSYSDYGLIGGVRYNYRLRAYKFVNGKRVFSNYSPYINTATIPPQPRIVGIQRTDTTATMGWFRLGSTGYELDYRDSSTSDWTRAATLTRLQNEYTITGLKPGTKYYFRLRGVTKDDNGKVFNGEYENRSTTTTGTATASKYNEISYYPTYMENDRLETVKVGSPKYSYDVLKRYDTNDNTKTTTTLSADDKAILADFASSHFTSSMTAADKLDYTMQWLNQMVRYADGQNGRPDYSVLYYNSDVYNCFVQRAGQCLQYNSALAAMANYLGYDAHVVWGKRGSSLSNTWQHFWCEINVNGKWYVADCYNYEKDGDWRFLCASYTEVRPWPWNAYYIINNKLMT